MILFWEEAEPGFDHRQSASRRQRCYACGNHTPGCQKIMAAVNANAASAARADASGKATFPGVTEGTYYLMISARYNNQALVWDMPVHLKAGDNSLTLDQGNASTVR